MGFRRLPKLHRFDGDIQLPHSPLNDFQQPGGEVFAGGDEVDDHHPLIFFDKSVGETAQPFELRRPVPFGLTAKAPFVHLSRLIAVMAHHIEEEWIAPIDDEFVIQRGVEPLFEPIEVLEIGDHTFAQLFGAQKNFDASLVPMEMATHQALIEAIAFIEALGPDPVSVTEVEGFIDDPTHLTQPL